MTDFLYIQLGIDAQLYMAQTHTDPNGGVQRPTWQVDRYRGFGLKEIEGPLTLQDYGILIPCDRKVTGAIRDFMDLQVLMAPNDNSGNTYFGPYYFSGDMTRSARYEPNPRALPGLFAGPDTAYAPAIIAREEPKPPGFLTRLFGKVSTDPADKNGHCNVRYNCWTASQGITQYIGGVDLSLIHPAFATTFRVWHANAAHADLLESLKSKCAPDYSVQEISDAVTLAHKGDNPPFLLINGGNMTLSEILSAKCATSNETIAAYLSKQTLFTNTPLQDHVHMKERQKIAVPAMAPA